MSEYFTELRFIIGSSLLMYVGTTNLGDRWWVSYDGFVTSPATIEDCDMLRFNEADEAGRLAWINTHLQGISLGGAA